MADHLQIFRSPLHFLHHVKCSVYDELVHVCCLLSELGRAIAARFRGAELMLEEWVVLRTNDGEVVRHDGETFRIRAVDTYVYTLVLVVESIWSPHDRCKLQASQADFRGQATQYGSCDFTSERYLETSHQR
jgi:hypothetical protein